MTDLDPQHIDDPELSAEQRAIRVAERSGMHVWSWGKGDYHVSKTRPEGAFWHWRNPALEEPMCNDSDPQAAARQLYEQFRDSQSMLLRMTLERDALTKQLAECRAELELTRTELASALAEGDVLTAERDKLRTACELGLRHFTPTEQQRELLGEHPQVLEVYDKVCRAFKAALEMTK